MIQEAYCSYEISKLLKEKGFNELCNKKYNGYKSLVDAGIMTELRQNSEFDVDEECSAPTHQIVMAWLREVYNIHIEIYVIKNYDKKVCKYTYTIMDLNFPGSDDGIDCCNKYNTYEEAVESALKYVLKKLI